MVVANVVQGRAWALYPVDHMAIICIIIWANNWSFTHRVVFNYTQTIIHVHMESGRLFIPTNHD